jgi:hypothetical protein
MIVVIDGNVALEFHWSAFLAGITGADAGFVFVGAALERKA